MDHFKADPLSRRDIRNMANRLRKQLGLSPKKPVDVLRLLEMLFPAAYSDSGFSLQILPPGEMGELHGLTDPINQVIYIREDVYDNAAQGKGRDRMTIAHELAHFLLHRGVRLGLARRAEGESIPRYMDPEWQATVFAAEFLMPAEEIRHMSVSDITSTYGVSRQAAAFQLSMVSK